MRTLDDILHRMQAHQSKKRPLLRALNAWNSARNSAQEPRRPTARPITGAAEPREISLHAVVKPIEQ
jgi:hypothetical protein